MRKRRKAKRNREIQNVSENLCEGLNDKINLPDKNHEAIRQEELLLLHPSKWKDADIKKIINCEADFFCEVLRRLSKEIECAHNLNDLDNIISLAAKLLQASAEKEKAIACRITASQGINNINRKNPACVCDLEDDGVEK